MDTLLSLLKTMAPAVATAVAGPLGGVAITALASKFGVADTVSAVAGAIAGDPMAAQKLQELELDYAKMQAADLVNARAMHVAAMQSDDPFVRRFTYYFIAAWTTFAVIFVPCVVFLPIPADNVRFADTIIGFLLGTVIASTFSFLLGSSFGSRTKDKK
jgi:predicted CDP-diglyceride synthetase/phosphatidate cytidylyltransferase